MTQVAGTKTANVVFIYNAIEYCSEQTVETSKIIHIVYFLTDDDGGAHRGGGRLGQEPQDINQVRPA